MTTGTQMPMEMTQLYLISSKMSSNHKMIYKSRKIHRRWIAHNLKKQKLFKLDWLLEVKITYRSSNNQWVVVSTQLLLRKTQTKAKVYHSIHHNSIIIKAQHLLIFHFNKLTLIAPVKTTLTQAVILFFYLLLLVVQPN